MGVGERTDIVVAGLESIIGAPACRKIVRQLTARRNEYQQLAESPGRSKDKKSKTAISVAIRRLTSLLDAFRGMLDITEREAETTGAASGRAAGAGFRFYKPREAAGMIGITAEAVRLHLTKYEEDLVESGLVRRGREYAQGRTWEVRDDYVEHLRETRGQQPAQETKTGKRPAADHRQHATLEKIASTAGKTRATTREEDHEGFYEIGEAARLLGISKDGLMDSLHRREETLAKEGIILLGKNAGGGQTWKVRKDYIGQRIKDREERGLKKYQWDTTDTSTGERFYRPRMAAKMAGIPRTTLRDMLTKNEKELLAQGYVRRGRANGLGYIWELSESYVEILRQRTAGRSGEHKKGRKTSRDKKQKGSVERKAAVRAEARPQDLETRLMYIGYRPERVAEGVLYSSRQIGREFYVDQWEVVSAAKANKKLAKQHPAAVIELPKRMAGPTETILVLGKYIGHVLPESRQEDFRRSLTKEPHPEDTNDIIKVYLGSGQPERLGRDTYYTYDTIAGILEVEVRGVSANVNNHSAELKNIPRARISVTSGKVSSHPIAMIKGDALPVLAGGKKRARIYEMLGIEAPEEGAEPDEKPRGAAPAPKSREEGAERPARGKAPTRRRAEAEAPSRMLEERAIITPAAAPTLTAKPETALLCVTAKMEQQYRNVLYTPTQIAHVLAADVKPVLAWLQEEMQKPGAARSIKILSKYLVGGRDNIPAATADFLRRRLPQERYRMTIEQMLGREDATPETEGIINAFIGDKPEAFPDDIYVSTRQIDQVVGDARRSSTNTTLNNRRKEFPRDDESAILHIPKCVWGSYSAILILGQYVHLVLPIHARNALRTAQEGGAEAGEAMQQAIQVAGESPREMGRWYDTLEAVRALMSRTGRDQEHVLAALDAAKRDDKYSRSIKVHAATDSVEYHSQVIAALETQLRQG